MKQRTYKIIIWAIMSCAIIALGIRLYKKPIGELQGFSFPTSYNYKKSEMYTQASSGKVSDVENLDINWVSGSVEIVSYDGKTVSFEEHSKGTIPEKDRMCYWKDGDTLRIQFTSSGLRVNMYSQKDLTVYVPASYKINNLEVDVVSADVFVSNLLSDKADFEAVSGNITLKNFGSHELDIETVSGSLIAENIDFDSLNGEAVSGDVSIALFSGSKPKKIVYETVSGGIEVQLPTSLGVDLDYDTVSGDFICRREMRKADKHRYVIGDGAVKMEVETVSGDITII